MMISDPPAGNWNPPLDWLELEEVLEEMVENEVVDEEELVEVVSCWEVLLLLLLLVVVLSVVSYDVWLEEFETAVVVVMPEVVVSFGAVEPKDEDVAEGVAVDESEEVSLTELGRLLAVVTVDAVDVPGVVLLGLLSVSILVVTDVVKGG